MVCIIQVFQMSANSTTTYHATQFERLYLSYIVSSDKNKTIDYPVAVIGYFRRDVGGYMLMEDVLMAHGLEAKGMYESLGLTGSEDFGRHIKRMIVVYGEKCKSTLNILHKQAMTILQTRGHRKWGSILNLAENGDPAKRFCGPHGPEAEPT